MFCELPSQHGNQPKLARAAQRRRGLADDDGAAHEIAVPWAPVNALLTGVLRLESWWLRVAGNAFGSSLLCLARKRE